MDLKNQIKMKVVQFVCKVIAILIQIVVIIIILNALESG